MASLGIHSKTKEGDQVWDGSQKFDVLHRLGDLLVLRPVYGEDPHHYVRHIKGGVRRFYGYQEALNAAALPVVAASVVMERATRGEA